MSKTVDFESKTLNKYERVFVGQADNYDGFAPKLRAALDEFPSFHERIRSARNVLLKPNVMGKHVPTRGRTTHPAFLYAVAVELRKMTKAKLVIGDGAGPGVHTQEAFEKTGIAEVASSLNIPLRSFTLAPYSTLEVPNPIFYDQLELIDELKDFDVVVNIPKLKTTYASPIAGMKNLMGLMSQPYRFMFHSYGLHEGVADLNSIVSAHLTVVDGILGCELRWPIEGKVFIVGEDPVATDVVCSQVMSIPTTKTPYIQMAAMKGLGEADPDHINVVGSKVEDVCKPFKIPPHDAPETLSMSMATVINCGACCIGCVGTIQKGLDDIERDGLLPQMKKHITILIGSNWRPEMYNPDTTLLVGNCTVTQERTWPHVVRGAPPLIHKFSAKLISMSK